MQFKYDTKPHAISIDVPSLGVYVFPPQGALGKTYLKKQLTKVAAKYNNTIIVSYTNLLNVKTVIEEQIKHNRDIMIIFLDRFDLYNTTENVAYVNSIRDKYVILVDYKRPELNSMLKYRACGIWLEEEVIRVTCP